MFKLFVWSAAISATGAAALFVPIDPSLLNGVGISDGEPAGLAGAAPDEAVMPARIVSSDGRPDTRSAFRIVSRSDSSPYRATNQAGERDTTENASRTAKYAALLPIPTAPRLVAPPAPATQPAKVTDQTVRSLQRELRRVGCYHGRIDGDWGPASRFAMAAFTKAVNAALPTDRPDVVLLTLVRRHSGTACGSARSPVLQAATPYVPRATVKTSSAWRVRVEPAKPSAAHRLVQAPRLAQSPPRLNSAPRIVRANGRQVPTVRVAQPTTTRWQGAGGAQRSPFAANRMSLGVVPEPRAAQPLTTDSDRANVQRRLPRRRAVERRRYKPARVRPRRANSRRRYNRKRRLRAWRRSVFPGIYN